MLRHLWTVVWREHAAMVLALSLSSALLATAAMTGRAPYALLPLADWPTLLISQLLALDLMGLAILVYRLRHRVPIREAIAAMRPTLLSPERVAGLAITTFCVRWIMLQAVAWKSSIPALHPFAFDGALASFGQLAAFGVAPWQWLQPIVESRLWLGILDVAYYTWFPVFVAVMLIVAWAPYGFMRRRFLLAVTLVWVMGSWLGVIVASAGPAYYRFVTGLPSSFDALMPFVHRNAPLATMVQASLWRSYIGSGGHLIAGISAFPSLHVAVPALFMFAAPRRWRCWAIVLCAETWLGSVLLGWHYAADGAGGILLALACWWLAGRLLARRPLRACCLSPGSASQHHPVAPRRGSGGQRGVE